MSIFRKRYVSCAVHLPVKMRISPKISLQIRRPSVGATTLSTVSDADRLQLFELLRYHCDENSFQKRYVLLLLCMYIKNGTHLKSGLTNLILFFAMSTFPSIHFEESWWNWSQIRRNFKKVWKYLCFDVWLVKIDCLQLQRLPLEVSHLTFCFDFCLSRRFRMYFLIESGFRLASIW